MQQPGVMEKLIENATEASWDTRKEALWALSNICTTGTDNHVQELIRYKGLQPLVEALSLKNADASVLVASCLDAIERVLEVGERNNQEYGRLFDEYDGIYYLENLQEHPSHSIYKKTTKIIESYFGGEEEEEGENLAPTTTYSGGISLMKPDADVTSNPSPNSFPLGVLNPARTGHFRQDVPTRPKRYFQKGK